MASQLQTTQVFIPGFRAARLRRAAGRSSAAGRRGHLRAACYAYSKRTLDLVLGSVLLCCSLPIIALAAIAIRLESRGNPLFIQTRVGENGKPFRIFKLRGMYADARARFPALYDYSKQEGLDFYFHHEQDPRITRVGSFIRKTSIDELPNFLNVVLGSMSLVGPRPEIPDVSALYGIHRDKYLSVKPGVTCLSKVSGRDLLTKEQSIRMDIGYIENRSTATDLKILWATFWSVINRRNVFGRCLNRAAAQ
ncbi:MAG: sugar transferase [Nitrosomonadales bacterium]|nr:sugar transferase [Nitrosomonadales bacterium]